MPTARERTLATLGPSYMYLVVLVPILSFFAIIYTLFRAARVRRDDSGFVFIHRQIAA
jgi:hypothetical protein